MSSILYNKTAKRGENVNSKTTSERQQWQSSTSQPFSRRPTARLLIESPSWSIERGWYPGWSIQGGNLAGPSRQGYPSWSIGGVLQLVHPAEGGPLPCSLLGGSTSVFTSRGVPCDLSHNALIYCYRMPSASWAKFNSRGVPFDLSHNALIYCYRMPQCIMGKIHMGPPLELNRLTDRQTLLKTLPSRTTLRVVKMKQLMETIVKSSKYET